MEAREMEVRGRGRVREVRESEVREGQPDEGRDGFYRNCSQLIRRPGRTHRPWPNRSHLARGTRCHL